MEELTYKDLNEFELDSLKDMYISSRVNSMTESDLREFAREIIIDQIKGTVGNAEEKEAWEEIKEHFSDDLGKKIIEAKTKCNKNKKLDLKSPEEIEFNKRLSLLNQQQEEKSEEIEKPFQLDTKKPQKPLSKEQEIGRNDKVTIQKEGKTQILKWKKAESMLAEGWELVGAGKK